MASQAYSFGNSVIEILGLKYKMALKYLGLQEYDTFMGQRWSVAFSTDECTRKKLMQLSEVF